MIIGITGKKRAGKDTAAKLLIIAYPHFKVVAFATPLKAMFAELFDIPVTELEFLKNDPTAHIAIGYINNPSEAPTDTDVSFAEASDGSVKMWTPAVEPITVRHGLQKMGTEIGRNMISEQLWINLLQEYLEQHEITDAIIPDVRFKNEEQWVHASKGVLIKVHRKSTDAPDLHISEGGIEDEVIDCDVTNDGTRVELATQLYEFMEYLKESNG